MRKSLQVAVAVALAWIVCSQAAWGQWPGAYNQGCNTGCNDGGNSGFGGWRGGWHSHMQNVRANFFGGANCGRGINQQQAEDLWGTYCHDDCTLFSGSGCGSGCGTGCASGCGTGFGWGGGCGRGGFGFGNCGNGGCDFNQGCGGAGGCGLFGGHGGRGLFGGHGGCGLFGGHRDRGCGCDQGNCFGWPGNDCGCDAGGNTGCGCGLLGGGRHIRCHRGLRTFDCFNGCGTQDHGCHVGNCGTRGRFFRFAIGHEFGCGDFNSCVGNSITASCGCDGAYVPVSGGHAPAVQPLQGTHGPTPAAPADSHASPSDHKN